MADNTSNTQDKPFPPSLPPGSSEAFGWWTFARWNGFLWLSLLGLGIFYGLLHTEGCSRKLGYGGEYTRLSKEQLAQVAAIYAKTPDSVGGKIDYASQIREFINSDFNDRVDKHDLDSVISYLRVCSNQEANMFLTNKRLKVQSYFWLSGSELYWEVTLWSIGGVLASLVFMLSSRHRKSVQYSDTDGPNEPFCTEEIPYQIGKLFYAPLMTLVLIFGYNYIEGDNRPDIFSSKGMLALAFLCGFFSGRVMTVINRIKEALMPAGNSSANETGDNSKDAKTDDTQNAVEGGAGTAGGSNLEITLHIDEGLDPALLSQIMAAGLRGGSSVSLKPSDGTGTPIIAQPSGADPVFTFKASAVPAGKYMLVATWEGDLEAAGDGSTKQEEDDNATPDAGDDNPQSTDSTLEQNTEKEEDENENQKSTAQPISLYAEQEVVIDGNSAASVEMTLHLA